MKTLRLALTIAVLAVTVGACADILGLEVLVETAVVDAGPEAAAPVPDAAATDN